MPFAFTDDHRRWARGRQRLYGGSIVDYLDLIARQHGRCALSGVSLIFDRAEGTPQKGGRGCHPLYAALDHASPAGDDAGHQITCYALNDLKGHLPLDCFIDLSQTPSWRRLMRAWRQQAHRDASDREAFRDILRAPHPTV